MESVRTDGGEGLLGAGLAFLAAFLLLTIAVEHHGLDRLDLAARGLLHRVQQPGLQGVMDSVSRVGGSPGQAAAIVLTCLVLWSRWREGVLALPLMMIGAWVVQLSAKWALDRPRPDLSAWGYPSAHVLSLMVLCGFVVHGVGRMSLRRGGRPVAGLVSAGVVGLVAFSRMYLDAHWLSDVLGGALAGLAYLLLALSAIDAAPRIRAALRRLPAGSAPDVVGMAPAVALGAVGPRAPADSGLTPAPARSVIEES